MSLSNRIHREIFVLDTHSRAEPGDELVIPRNSSERPTPSKLALLKAIKATGADWSVDSNLR